LEELIEGCALAGPVKAIGWMKTWPELYTYSHYEPLRSIVLRGFAAILQEGNLGGGYDEAASTCGKPLVMERLSQPTDEIKARLLGLMDVEHFGPKVELTPERLEVVRAVLKVVLTAADWGAIAQAAADQVQQQVMALAA
jgi:hypothetical protein